MGTVCQISGGDEGPTRRHGERGAVDGGERLLILHVSTLRGPRLRIIVDLLQGMRGGQGNRLSAAADRDTGIGQSRGLARHDEGVGGVRHAFDHFGRDLPGLFQEPPAVFPNAQRMGLQVLQRVARRVLEIAFRDDLLGQNARPVCYLVKRLRAVRIVERKAQRRRPGIGGEIMGPLPINRVQTRPAEGHSPCIGIRVDKKHIVRSRNAGRVIDLVVIPGV